MNSKASRTTLQFYVLVTLLYQEAEYVQLQATLLSTKKLRRHQRTKYKKTQGRIFALWEKYEESAMTTSAFLREAGLLYQLAIDL